MNAGEWAALAGWWIAEGSRDPLYEDAVLPWLADLIGSPAGPILDLGCGEGQVMRHLDAKVIGCDLVMELLREAARKGPVVQSRLPHVPWLRDGAVVGSCSLFVLEHLADLRSLFLATARIVEPGGFLVVIANHPAYTASGAGPLVDEEDGEVLWRWGTYFSQTAHQERVGHGQATYYHRTLGDLLTQAADAGWILERFEERGLDKRMIAVNPSLVGQEHMPRMIGVRWVRPTRNREAVVGGFGA